MKSRSEKQKIVDVLHESFSNAISASVASYQGLNSGEMDELRKELRALDVKYYVVKNTLARKAAEGTQFSEMTASLKGPVSIAISLDNPVNPAKGLFEFSKDHKALKLLSGCLDGKLLSEKEIKALAALPDLDGMRSVLLSVLSGLGSKFVRLLDAYKTSKEEN